MESFKPVRAEQKRVALKSIYLDIPDADMTYPEFTMLDEKYFVYKESSTDADGHIKLCKVDNDTRRPSTCPWDLCKFIVVLPSLNFPFHEHAFNDVDAVWTSTFSASRQLQRSHGMVAAVIPRSTFCPPGQRVTLTRDSSGIQGKYVFLADASDDISFKIGPDLVTSWCGAFASSRGSVQRRGRR